MAPLDNQKYHSELGTASAVSLKEDDSEPVNAVELGHVAQKEGFFSDDEHDRICAFWRVPAFGEKFSGGNSVLKQQAKVPTGPAHRIRYFFSHTWSPPPDVDMQTYVEHKAAAVSSLGASSTTFGAVAPVSGTAVPDDFPWFLDPPEDPRIGRKYEGKVLTAEALGLKDPLHRWWKCKVWIDKASCDPKTLGNPDEVIAQVELALMKTDELVVLFTWHYFTRLWCVLEWASFLSARAPHYRRIVLQIPDGFLTSKCWPKYIEGIRNFDLEEAACSSYRDKAWLWRRVEQLIVSKEGFERFTQAIVISLLVRYFLRLVSRRLCAFASPTKYLEHVVPLICLARDLGLNSLADILLHAEPVRWWRQSGMTERRPSQQEDTKKKEKDSDDFLSNMKEMVLNESSKKKHQRSSETFSEHKKPKKDVRQNKKDYKQHPEKHQAGKHHTGEEELTVEKSTAETGAALEFMQEGLAEKVNEMIDGVDSDGSRKSSKDHSASADDGRNSSAAGDLEGVESTADEGQSKRESKYRPSTRYSFKESLDNTNTMGRMADKASAKPQGMEQFLKAQSGKVLDEAERLQAKGFLNHWARYVHLVDEWFDSTVCPQLERCRHVALRGKGLMETILPLLPVEGSVLQTMINELKPLKPLQVKKGRLFRAQTKLLTGNRPKDLPWLNGTLGRLTLMRTPEFCGSSAPQSIDTATVFVTPIEMSCVDYPPHNLLAIRELQVGPNAGNWTYIRCQRKLGLHALSVAASRMLLEQLPVHKEAELEVKVVLPLAAVEASGGPGLKRRTRMLMGAKVEGILRPMSQEGFSACMEPSTLKTQSAIGHLFAEEPIETVEHSWVAFVRHEPEKAWEKASSGMGLQGPKTPAKRSSPTGAPSVGWSSGRKQQSRQNTPASHRSRNNTLQESPGHSLSPASPPSMQIPDSKGFLPVVPHSHSARAPGTAPGGLRVHSVLDPATPRSDRPNTTQTGRKMPWDQDRPNTTQTGRKMPWDQDRPNTSPSVSAFLSQGESSFAAEQIRKGKASCVESAWDFKANAKGGHQLETGPVQWTGSIEEIFGQAEIWHRLARPEHWLPIDHTGSLEEDFPPADDEFFQAHTERCEKCGNTDTPAEISLEGSMLTHIYQAPACKMCLFCGEVTPFHPDGPLNPGATKHGVLEVTTSVSCPGGEASTVAKLIARVLRVEAEQIAVAVPEAPPALEIARDESDSVSTSRKTRRRRSSLDKDGNPVGNCTSQTNAKCKVAQIAFLAADTAFACGAVAARRLQNIQKRQAEEASKSAQDHVGYELVPGSGELRSVAPFARDFGWIRHCLSNTGLDMHYGQLVAPSAEEALDDIDDRQACKRRAKVNPILLWAELQHVLSGDLDIKTWIQALISVLNERYSNKLKERMQQHLLELRILLDSTNDDDVDAHASNPGTVDLSTRPLNTSDFEHFSLPLHRVFVVGDTASNLLFDAALGRCEEVGLARLRQRATNALQNAGPVAGVLDVPSLMRALAAARSLRGKTSALVNRSRRKLKIIQVQNFLDAWMKRLTGAAMLRVAKKQKNEEAGKAKEEEGGDVLANMSELVAVKKIIENLEEFQENAEIAEQSYKVLIRFLGRGRDAERMRILETCLVTPKCLGTLTKIVKRHKGNLNVLEQANMLFRRLLDSRVPGVKEQLRGELLPQPDGFLAFVMAAHSLSEEDKVVSLKKSLKMIAALLYTPRDEFVWPPRSSAPNVDTYEDSESEDEEGAADQQEEQKDFTKTISEKVESQEQQTKDAKEEQEEEEPLPPLPDIPDEALGEAVNLLMEILRRHPEEDINTCILKVFLSLLQYPNVCSRLMELGMWDVLFFNLSGANQAQKLVTLAKTVAKDGGRKMEELTWNLLSTMAEQSTGLGGLSKEHRRAVDSALQWMQREPRVATTWHAAGRTVFRLLGLGRAYVTYAVEHGIIEILMQELPNWEAAASLPCLLRLLGGQDNDFAQKNDVLVNDQVLNKLFVGNCVALLSPTLKHHRLDVNVQNNVVQLLCKLLTQTAAVTAFQKADGVPQVIEILKVHRKNQVVVKHTLFAMNQVMLDLSRSEELVKAGHINKTVKVLKKHIQNKDVRFLALQAINKTAGFNPATIKHILNSWENEVHRLPPDEIPQDVEMAYIILKLENYTHYGGGTALEATNWMLKFPNDPEVVKHGLQCLRSKAWDPQKRLEFKEIPDFVTSLCAVTKGHNRNREVLMAAAELTKVSMERGLMSGDDPNFEEFGEFAVSIIENNLSSQGNWKPVHWLLILDITKLLARRPIGLKILVRRGIRGMLLQKMDAGGEELRAMTNDVLNILNQSTG